MEALHLHSNTHSHWSSGSTVCFSPRGDAVRVLGMHPHLQCNQVLLLAKSRYISDPDMIDHNALLGLCANNGMFHWAVAPTMWKADVVSQRIYPVPFQSLEVLLFLTTLWLLRAPSHVVGGGGGALWRPCSFAPIHSLTGSVGQPFASCPRGLPLRVPGIHPHFQ